MPYPFLAGSRDASVAAVPQLFAGDGDVRTDSAPALADIAQWQICVLLNNGITPYVPATHTTAAPDKLVISQVAVTNGQQCPYYSSGSFNHAVLGWPAALDTLPKRKEAFQGSMISINHLI